MESIDPNPYQQVDLIHLDQFEFSTGFHLQQGWANVLQANHKRYWDQIQDGYIE